MIPTLPPSPRLSRFSQEGLSRVPNPDFGLRAPSAPAWSGTREGALISLIAIVGILLFGGAAGHWFAADAGWFGQALRISGGTMAMASLVSLLGPLCVRRDPIFWGIAMPLLVYVVGSLCAFASAGAVIFLIGAPVFCSLGVLAGVLTAYVTSHSH